MKCRRQIGLEIRRWSYINLNWFLKHCVQLRRHNPTFQERNPVASYEGHMTLEHAHLPGTS
jgi:hypothetical protein